MRELIKNQKTLCTNLKTYMIIGAMDGIKYDRVFNYLSNRTDYKALFVEPVNHQFLKLKENVKQLKGKIYCERSVVLNENRNVNILSVNSEFNDKYPDFIDGCSSIIEDNSPINIFIKKVEEEHKIYENFLSLTFEDLVKKYNFNDVDYVQIDTEGCDHKIVDSIDFDKHSIKILKFELYYLPSWYVQDISNRLKQKNYTTVVDGEDVLCIHNDYYDQVINTNS